MTWQLPKIVTNIKTPKRKNTNDRNQVKVHVARGIWPKSACNHPTRPLAAKYSRSQGSLSISLRTTLCSWLDGVAQCAQLHILPPCPLQTLVQWAAVPSLHKAWEVTHGRQGVACPTPQEAPNGRPQVQQWPSQKQVQSSEELVCD